MRATTRVILLAAALLAALSLVACAPADDSPATVDYTGGGTTTPPPPSPPPPPSSPYPIGGTWRRCMAYDIGPRYMVEVWTFSGALPSGTFGYTATDYGYTADCGGTPGTLLGSGNGTYDVGNYVDVGGVWAFQLDINYTSPATTLFTLYVVDDTVSPTRLYLGAPPTDAMGRDSTIDSFYFTP